MKKSRDFKRLFVFVLSLLLFSNSHSQTKQDRHEENLSATGVMVSERNDQAASIYAISNKKSGLFLRPFSADRKDGIKIVLYPEHNWECLKWEMDPVGDDAFYLKNLFTHKTFQPESEVSTLSRVVQQPLNKNNPLQQWSFIKRDKDYYQIKHAQSGLYLTAQGKDAYNQQVFLSEWKNLDEQQWRMKEVSAESDL